MEVYCASNFANTEVCNSSGREGILVPESINASTGHLGQMCPPPTPAGSKILKVSIEPSKLVIMQSSMKCGKEKVGRGGVARNITRTARLKTAGGTCSLRTVGVGRRRRLGFRERSVSHTLEDCYEFLFPVSTACEKGVKLLYESRGMKVLASKMFTFQDGSHELELAIKLLKLVISKVSLDIIQQDYLSELSMMVSLNANWLML